MRRSHRDRDEQGLAEERRRLIHRYMADSGQPTTPSTPPEMFRAELSVVASSAASAAFEETEQSTTLSSAGTAAGIVQPGQESDEHGHQAPDAELRLLPAARQRVDVDVARQMLEEVRRLCGHLDRLAREADGRRIRLAAAIPRGTTPASVDAVPD
jgi:hypothetical protein